MNWHTETIEAVFERLKSNVQGLSKQEASKRLLEYSKNVLHEKKTKKTFEYSTTAV